MLGLASVLCPATRVGKGVVLGGQASAEAGADLMAQMLYLGAPATALFKSPVRLGVSNLANLMSCTELHHAAMMGLCLCVIYLPHSTPRRLQQQVSLQIGSSQLVLECSKCLISRCPVQVALHTFSFLELAACSKQLLNVLPLTQVCCLQAHSFSCKQVPTSITSQSHGNRPVRLRM
jgi:hypothetical protein